MFKVILEKKKNSNPNQEFKVNKVYNSFIDFIIDALIKMESSKLYINSLRSDTFIEYEFDIIENIKRGDVYKTRNSVGYTLCEVGVRNGVEYLTTKSNDTKNDNIGALPTYD